MGDHEKDSRAIPPYATFTSFIGFINNLREHPLPPVIDRSLMNSMSGSTQAALLACLRYLRLIDETYRPSTDFEQLIKLQQQSNEYKSTLKRVLESSYPFLSDGSLDISRATSKQLEETLRNYGVGGSTVGKAIAFFIAACKECDLAVSSHITVRKQPRAKANGSANGRHKVQKKKIDPHEPDEHQHPPAKEDVPKGVIRFEVPLGNKHPAKIILPESMTKAEWMLIKTIIEAQANFVLSQGNEKED
jgi:hypothetical protein